MYIENRVGIRKYALIKPGGAPRTFGGIVEFSNAHSRNDKMPLANASLLDETAAAASCDYVFNGRSLVKYRILLINFLFRRYISSNIEVIKTEQVLNIEVVVGNHEKFEFTPMVLELYSISNQWGSERLWRIC